MRHILFDLIDCPFDLLDEEEFIKESLVHAAIVAKSPYLKVETHKFEPQGVTALVMLSESHISIHTWPELGKAACDIYTCGDCDPQIGGFYIRESLLSGDSTVVYIDRE